MSDATDPLTSDPIDALLRPPERRSQKPILIGACVAVAAVAILVMRSGRSDEARSSITADDLPFAGASPTSSQRTNIAAGGTGAPAGSGSARATTSPSGGPSGASGVSGASGLAPDPVITELVVHVAGAVRTPGVYRLRPDARLEDAVAAAGGLSAAADTNRVNLAERVSDGSRLYVPKRGETSIPEVAEPDGSTSTGQSAAAGSNASGTSSASGKATAPTGPIDLNTADQTALETLPGVGPATAAAIISFREREGPLTSVDQLLDVPGIGTSKLEQIAPNATV